MTPRYLPTSQPLPAQLFHGSVGAEADGVATNRDATTEGGGTEPASGRPPTPPPVRHHIGALRARSVHEPTLVTPLPVPLSPLVPRQVVVRRGSRRRGRPVVSDAPALVSMLVGPGTGGRWTRSRGLCTRGSHTQTADGALVLGLSYTSSTATSPVPEWGTPGVDPSLQQVGTRVTG